MSDRPHYYRLEGHTPVPVDIEHWSEAFNCQNRHVNETCIGDVRVSTVFLGIDRTLTGIGPPILFETMVFGGAMGKHQEHYSTWDEAERGHEFVCQLVRNLRESNDN